MHQPAVRFGHSFGEGTKVIRVDVAPNALTANRLPDLDLVGDARGLFDADAGCGARVQADLSGVHGRATGIS